MSVLAGDYVQASATNWISGISYRDHMRLRAAVRRVHMRYTPEMLYSHADADRIIEALGPVVGEKMIKALVDGKIQ